MSSLSFPGFSISGSDLPPQRTHRVRRRSRLLLDPMLVPLEQPIVRSAAYSTGASAASGGMDDLSNGGNWSLQLSRFTRTGSVTALDLPHSVLQSTGDLRLAVTNALAIPGNSSFFKNSAK